MRRSLLIPGLVLAIVAAFWITRGPAIEPTWQLTFDRRPSDVHWSRDAATLWIAFDRTDEADEPAAHVVAVDAATGARQPSTVWDDVQAIRVIHERPDGSLVVVRTPHRRRVDVLTGPTLEELSPALRNEDGTERTFRSGVRPVDSPHGIVLDDRPQMQLLDADTLKLTPYGPRAQGTVTAGPAFDLIDRTRIDPLRRRDPATGTVEPLPTTGWFDHPVASLTPHGLLTIAGRTAIAIDDVTIDAPAPLLAADASRSFAHLSRREVSGWSSLVTFVNRTHLFVAQPHHDVTLFHRSRDDAGSDRIDRIVRLPQPAGLFISSRRFARLARTGVSIAPDGSSAVLIGMPTFGRCTVQRVPLPTE